MRKTTQVVLKCSCLVSARPAFYHRATPHALCDGWPSFTPASDRADTHHLFSAAYEHQVKVPTATKQRSYNQSLTSLLWPIVPFPQQSLRTLKLAFTMSNMPPVTLQLSILSWLLVTLLMIHNTWRTHLCQMFRMPGAINTRSILNRNRVAVVGVRACVQYNDHYWQRQSYAELSK